jgi:hypothetical protein
MSFGYFGSRDIEVEDDAASLLKGLIRPADGPARTCSRRASLEPRVHIEALAPV